MPPHPADAVRDLDALADGVRDCRLCGTRVVPPGVLWARPEHRAVIWGQSPGALEVERQMPFVGPAGRRLRGWFAPLGVCDEASFHARFAVVAVTKCYPGKSPAGRGDRLPARDEIELCRPWSDAALRLLDPPLVIPVGRLALLDWLGDRRLSEVVGRRFEIAGRTVIPLPHPSGASSWTNDPAHLPLIERAVELIGERLRDIS